MPRLLLLVLVLAAFVRLGAATGPAAAQIKLTSGVTLNYAVQGPADGEPIVLLHGIGDSWRSFELLLPRIPDRYRVYALSLRGHGWSDAPASGYALADFASDVTAFLNQMNLRRVTLVGHSLGSLVAQAVAVEDSSRLARLVLMGSGPGGLVSPDIRAEAQAMFRAIRAPIDKGFARDFQMSVVHAPVPAAFMDTMYEQIILSAPQMWPEAADGLHSPATGEAIKRIKVPALLIWGDKDAFFVRADQDALLARIPNSRLVVFPDVGHVAHWEDPERVAKEIVAFISPN